MAAPPPPGTVINFGLVTGPFAAGMMVCCPLFGITCAQTIYYYRMYPGDLMYRKILVGVLFLLDTAHMAFVAEAIHHIYVYCKFPPNTPHVLNIALSFGGAFTMIVILTSVVQGFYAWRAWTLSQRHPWRKPIVGAIIVLSFLQFVFGIGNNVYLYFQDTIDTAHFPVQQALYSLQLATAMLCDITITVALVYFLNRSRSGFRSSEYAVDRLVLYSVNVGLITTVVSILTFITFYAIPQSTLFTLFGESIAKLYVNSMLVTLNSRNSIRKALGATQTSSSGKFLQLSKLSQSTTSTRVAATPYQQKSFGEEQAKFPA